MPGMGIKGTRKKVTYYLGNESLVDEVIGLKSCDLECEESERKEREKYWINKMDCVNIIKYNYNHKEYQKQYQKQYQKPYREDNKDKAKEYRKIWYKNNIEYKKQYNKEYYLKNKK